MERDTEWWKERYKCIFNFRISPQEMEKFFFLYRKDKYTFFFIIFIYILLKKREKRS